jgi:hypothetical protein
MRLRFLVSRCLSATMNIADAAAPTRILPDDDRSMAPQSA